MVYVASEVGVLGDVLSNAGNVVAKGRLGPGQMVCADLEAGTFKTNTEIARDAAARAPYADWLAASARRLSDLGASRCGRGGAGRGGGRAAGGEEGSTASGRWLALWPPPVPAPRRTDLPPPWEAGGKFPSQCMARAERLLAFP